MTRGEIWWAELRPRSDSEQQGNRPVIVVSHDGFNRTPTWRSVIVVPLSRSEAQARRGPTAIAIDKSGTGLTDNSVALCHQVTTLDRRKLTRRIGLIDTQQLHAIEKGLLAALAIRAVPPVA
jgi:mRNA interferase MazF